MQNTKRKSGAVRREEIAVAALRIIGERGIASLTTSTLAEEVGVTTGALFRHFKSREAILQEAARHALAKIESTFPDPTLPPLERLLALAENRVRIVGADPGVAWVLRSEQAYLSLPPDAVAQLRDLVRRSKGFVLTALRDGSADGTIRTDIAPETLFVPVMGTIHALIGMAGIHATAGRTRGSSTARVLAALAILLAPTDRVPGDSDPIQPEC
ncbi:TetR/AcrR family transcriptional regulator [bacterium]|nr:TetR/AcrR family transcriptional regulator [bacterium]